MVKAPLNDWFEKRDKRVQELANEVAYLKAKYHYRYGFSMPYLDHIAATNSIDEYLNLCRTLRGIVDETKQWIDLQRKKVNLYLGI